MPTPGYTLRPGDKALVCAQPCPASSHQHLQLHQGWAMEGVRRRSSFSVSALDFCRIFLTEASDCSLQEVCKFPSPFLFSPKGDSSEPWCSVCFSLAGSLLGEILLPRQFCEHGLHVFVHHLVPGRSHTPLMTSGTSVSLSIFNFS